MEISYAEYESRKQAAQDQGPRIGYFALKNDNDEAIVRFMHDDVSTFDINVVHTATIDNKFRKVNCIRDIKEPVDNCPLCAAGNPVSKRLYIHLIEYVKQDDGSIKAVPKFWDRSSAYVSTLKSLCDEYAPLSNYLFKIKRHGFAGSTDTTYDILFVNQANYQSDEYREIPDSFSNVKAVGRAIINKSFQELKALVSQQQPEPTPIDDRPPFDVDNTATQAASYNVSAEPTVIEQPRTYTTATVESSDQIIRPRRVY